MVKKFFAFAGLTVLTGVFAASAMAGCSSSDPAPGDQPGTDGGPTGRDVVVPDGEPPTCYAPDEAPGDGTILTTNFAGGRCTEAQFDALVDGCFGDSGSAEACKAATDASEECTDCLLGGGQDNPNKDYAVFTTLTEEGQGLLTGVYSCIGLELNKPDCIKPVLDQLICVSLACLDCDEAGTDACETQAANDVCSGLANAECVKAFNDADDATIAKCIKSGDSSATLKLSGKRVCVAGKGGGSPDAGTDAGEDAGQ